jgi:hypothetical protein
MKRRGVGHVRPDAVFAITIVASLLTACGAASDPRAASKENFQRVIDGKVGKLCLQSGDLFDALVLPYRTLVGPRPTTAMVPFDVHETDAKMNRRLEALEAARLTVKQKVTLTLPHYFIYGAKRTNVNVPVVVFDRGPEFAKYAPDAKPGPVSVGALCYASLQVDHIDNYTEPGQMMGATVSEVNYHAKVGEIADWATAPEMRAAFPEIQEQLQAATTTSRTATVVLMNDGWQAQ